VFTLTICTTTGLHPGLTPKQLHTNQLHVDLLGSDSGYDKSVLPADCVVEFGLVVNKITKVETSDSGSLTLSSWLRLQWIDNRLAWNPADYGGVTKMAVAIEPNPKEAGVIWTPDVELTNLKEALHTSFAADKQAIVNSSGRVFWSRPGLLQALCKYRGLVNFPTDTLSCVLEFGSWTFSTDDMRLIPRVVDGGITWMNDAGQSKDGHGRDVQSGTPDQSQYNTAGTVYSDYSLDHINVTTSQGQYDCCPGVMWDMLYYTITMSRSSNFYFWALTFPQTVMALLSTVQFFMCADSGERLGFGITLILAIQTTNMIAASYMPITNIYLKMDIINIMSLCCCVFSVFQTTVVLWLWHPTHDRRLDTSIHLIPPALTRLFCMGKKNRERFKLAETMHYPLANHDQIPTSPSRTNSKVHVLPEEQVSDALSDSGRGNISENWSGSGTGAGIGVELGTSVPPSLHRTGANQLLQPLEHQPTSGLAQDLMRAQIVSRVEQSKEKFLESKESTLRHRRVTAYRLLFFHCDHDQDGKLDMIELGKFGRYLAGSGWLEIWENSEYVHEQGLDDNPHIECQAFCDFLENVLFVPGARQDLEYVDSMVSGFIEKKKAHDKAAISIWRRRAQMLDDVCAYVLLPVYVIILAIVTSVEFSEPRPGHNA